MYIIRYAMRYNFKKVTEVMNERAMTLDELAKLAKVHVSTISKALQRGSAHQKTAKGLCRALRIPMKALLLDRSDAA